MLHSSGLRHVLKSLSTDRVATLQVDSSRNLLYVRGQVPGPVGRFVYLRDAVRNTHEFRSKFAIPFPSFCGDAATAPVVVFKSSKDPYLMYRSETDYFPINWKKGD